MTSLRWEPILKEPVGALLRRARLEAGMTQAHLAQLAGITASVLSKYELGSREPSATALLDIMRAACYKSATQDAIVAEEAGPVTPEADEDERRAILRARVLDHLRAQGFKPTTTGILAPVESEKGKLRALHAEAVRAQRARAQPVLQRHETRFLRLLAEGRNVEPSKVRPYLQLVDDYRSVEGLMWRWCSLHWSIPVSGGYGRRLRFLVRDAGHGNAVVGLIGLGDPVYSLGCREGRVGWDGEQRKQRLACVMDAFVLGAVPPYDRLLGGKLMALLAGADVVQRAFGARYGHRETLIAGRDPDARLALITTSSALGRSSVYNRVTRPDGALALHPVGYTQGSGDFHFSGSIYAELAALAASTVESMQDTHRHQRWSGGVGFRNRREVIQRALAALGLDAKALRMHGVRRQVFLNPLADNSYQWLRGEIDELSLYPAEATALADWWRSRWAIPRSRSNQSWRDFHPVQWQLYGGAEPSEELIEQAG